MNDMSDRELDRIVGNDREWRKFIISEIRELRKESGDLAINVNTLKVKAGFFSAIIGFIAGVIGSKL